MGCVESHPDSNDMHATIFPVESYDEHGQRHRSVKLEVTDTNLVLHNKNKTAIRWPLRCLRRYGFDGETFTFESGRRCPTGPGIYTYRCRRAQDLFNMLQLKIQRIAEQSAPQHLPTLVAQDDYLMPLPSNRLRSDSVLVQATNMAMLPGHTGALIPTIPNAILTNSNSINSPLASPNSPVSPANGTLYINNAVLPHDNVNDLEVGTFAPPPTPAPDGIRVESVGAVWINCNDRSVSFNNGSDRPSSHISSNSDRPLSSSSPMNHIERPLSFIGQGGDTAQFMQQGQMSESYESNSTSCTRTPDISESACHVYMNVGSDNRRDLDRLYANMGFDKDIPNVPPRLSITTGSAGSGSSQSGTTTTDTTQPTSQVNYIVVDVDKGSDSSQVPPFSPIGSITSGLPESPPCRSITGRYATIDFERTEALTNTAKMANCHANGGRHNSVFLDSPDVILPMNGRRHNSTVSAGILPFHNNSYSE